MNQVIVPHGQHSSSIAVRHDRGFVAGGDSGSGKAIWVQRPARSFDAAARIVAWGRESPATICLGLSGQRLPLAIPG
jgi:hypothetical protein